MQKSISFSILLAFRKLHAGGIPKRTLRHIPLNLKFCHPDPSQEGGSSHPKSLNERKRTKCSQGQTCRHLAMKALPFCHNVGKSSLAALRSLTFSFKALDDHF